MAWENLEYVRSSAIVRPSERIYTWIGVITTWSTLLTNISHWSIDIVLMYEVELQIIDKSVIRSFLRTADPSVILDCGFTRSKRTGIVFQGMSIIFFNLGSGHYLRYPHWQGVGKVFRRPPFFQQKFSQTPFFRVKISPPLFSIFFTPLPSGQ